MKLPLRSLVLVFSIALAGALHASNLVIDEVILQTIQTPQPPGTNIITGSGSAENTTTWATGVVGQFIMYDSTTNSYVGMNVTATSPTGSLSPSADSLMVARTVDSQGLTDPGTLSVYVRPSSSSVWSLTLGFDFYQVTGSPGSFTITSTPQSVGLQLTSLDIDFNQRYFTSNSTFTSNFRYSPTNVTVVNTNTSATGGTGFTEFSAGGDSTFNNPAHAVSSKGVGSSYTVQVAHNAVALYMFEFRDPSSIVPEPSSVVLIGLGSVLFLGFVRRVRSAC